MKTEHRHSIPEIRHHRARVIKRKNKLVKDLYDGHWYKYQGELCDGKIHCSCPRCAAKTNSRKTNGNHHTWKISDLRKIESMNYDLKNCYDYYTINNFFDTI